jgi:transketolase
MRDSFIQSLIGIAKKDKDLVLLTGDLGFRIFDEFERTFPGQYFNVGVAEQNLTSIASGLALEGKKVFTYSLGNFPTLRCLEQIRNDACYHDLNVNIVASGGGFSYGQLGMSHHATEDIAIMRALPNVTVLVPSNPWEAVHATQELYASKGVGYLRIDKTNGIQENSNSTFKIGTSISIQNGNDVCFIVCGGIINEVIDSAKSLKESGISSEIISMHTVKPLDENILAKVSGEYKLLVSVEEGNVIGGLGSAISEFCMESGNIPKKFMKIGLKDIYSSIVGDQAYLRAKYQMDSKYITKAVLEKLST